MKRICLLLLLCWGSFSITTAAGIEFTEITSQSEWESAIQQAKSQKKNLFVDVYATWCGPCKMMDRKTFAQKAVGDFYNENFINLKVNGEIIIGELFVQEYQVESYPYYLFLDAQAAAVNGDDVWPAVVNSQTGFTEVPEFLDLGEKTLNLKGQIAEWEKGMKNGSLGLDQIYEYTMHLSEAGQESKAEEVAMSYLNDKELDELMPYKTWEMIKAFATDLDHPLTKRIADNYTQFVHMRGEEEVVQYFAEVLKMNVMMATLEEDEALLEKTLGTLTPLLAKVGDNKLAVMEIDLAARQTYYGVMEQYDKYISVTNEYIKQYAAGDGDFLFEQAKTIWEEELVGLYDAGEDWARQAVEIESDFGNNFVYLLLLVKNGKKRAAKGIYDELDSRNLGPEERRYLEEVRSQVE